MQVKMPEEKIILHVELEYEAATVVGTLKDANIPSYWQPTPSKGMLGLPGAMGIPDKGYDVFAAEDNVPEANKILLGMGYTPLIDSAQDDTPEEQEEAAPEQESDESGLSDKEKLQQSIDELSPGRRIFYSIMLAIFGLAGLTLFVWLCDRLIELVMGLF